MTIKDMEAAIIAVGIGGIFAWAVIWKEILGLAKEIDRLKFRIASIETSEEKKLK